MRIYYYMLCMPICIYIYTLYTHSHDMYFVDLFETHKPSMMLFIFTFSSTELRQRGNDPEPSDLSKSKATPLRMGFSQFLVKMYEPSLCPMTSYSAVFWGSTGLNIRCFDSIFPIERWPKSGGRSSGSTEFCNNFEMSGQEFTILQDVLCTEMLSHIVSCSVWLDVEPLNSSVDGFQQRNLSCRSNRIRGEGSQKNFLLSEWHVWWEKSGFGSL